MTKAMAISSRFIRVELQYVNGNRAVTNPVLLLFNSFKKVLKKFAYH